MNINDFDAPDFDPNWLSDIFTRQTSLIEKYANIEGMPEYPFSSHTREGQKWFKDFLWRVTEEMGESYEAYVFNQMEDNEEKKDAHYTHQIEELIDALHFIVELVILTGKDATWAREQLDSAELITDKDDIHNFGMEMAYWQVTFYLGMVGNTLKNKPWKQTEMPTDEEKFFANLGRSFKALFVCLEYAGADEKQVYSYYTRKHQVNQFRQRSAY